MAKIKFVEKSEKIWYNENEQKRGGEKATKTLLTCASVRVGKPNCDLNL